ncbi:hypothetical protein [Pseudanabaena sp. lw0831]|uniref:hypothetical protein n=1 Tax=Pseudanabaena sp. lw0831 TaxID=1357935 RepID=UPI001F3BC1A2|nr:hypothetical protein [Pseudanabaena sp. lw0831]
MSALTYVIASDCLALLIISALQPLSKSTNLIVVEKVTVVSSDNFLTTFAIRPDGYVP